MSFRHYRSSDNDGILMLRVILVLAGIIVLCIKCCKWCSGNDERDEPIHNAPITAQRAGTPMQQSANSTNIQMPSYGFVELPTTLPYPSGPSVLPYPPATNLSGSTNNLPYPTTSLAPLLEKQTKLSTVKSDVLPPSFDEAMMLRGD